MWPARTRRWIDTGEGALDGPMATGAGPEPPANSCRQRRRVCAVRLQFAPVDWAKAPMQAPLASEYRQRQWQWTTMWALVRAVLAWPRCARQHHRDRARAPPAPLHSSLPPQGFFWPRAGVSPLLMRLRPKHAPGALIDSPEHWQDCARRARRLPGANRALSIQNFPLRQSARTDADREQLEDCFRGTRRCKRTGPRIGRIRWPKSRKMSVPMRCRLLTTKHAHPPH